jgi:hypothetical protein
MIHSITRQARALGAGWSRRSVHNRRRALGGPAQWLVGNGRAALGIDHGRSKIIM